MRPRLLLLRTLLVRSLYFLVLVNRKLTAMIAGSSPYRLWLALRQRILYGVIDL